MSGWQQTLASEVKFNTYRAPSNSGFKSLYLRRRAQLLQNSNRFNGDPKEVQNYINIRTALLQQRYKLSVDQLSQRSFSTSIRSTSRATMEAKSDKYSSRAQLTKPIQSNISSTSIAENYAFSGVHHIFDQHKDSVTMVKFGYNDATLLGCASMDGDVTVCRLEEAGNKVIHTLKKHTAGVTGFDWSCSNDLFVSCGMDGQLCIWDVARGSYLRSVTDQAKSQLLCCTFHPLNSNWVVSGNCVGLVQVLNVSTGRFPPGGTSQIADAVTAITFDAGGNILWAGNSKGSITAFKFDMRTGRLKKCRRTSVVENAAITCLSVRSWASRNNKESTLLVNIASNSLFVFRVTDDNGSLKIKRSFTIPHSSFQVQSTFSPIISFRQGCCVVSGSEDGKVWILDIERESNPIINKLQGHAAPVLSVSFAYDESLMASSDAGGLVIVWKRHQNIT